MRRSLLLAVLFAASSSQAQTTDLVARLSSDMTSTMSGATGMALIRLTDNAAPAGDFIVVRGQFRGLGSAYLSSRIVPVSGGSVGQALNAGLAEGGQAGGWGATENSFGVSDELSAAIRAGAVYVEVRTQQATDAELRASPLALPVVLDGRLDEGAYETIGTKQNANAGFGPDIDVTSTRVALGNGSPLVVIGLTGRLNTASSDGIALWGGSATGGVAAGTSLGGTPAAGHYLGATEHPNFKADFPVNVAFALNTGGGTQSAFLDVVLYQTDGTTTVRRADYLGAAAQDGGVAIGPPDLTANDGTSAPPLPDVAFAFLNDGAATSGFEIVLDASALGLPVPVAFGGDSFEVNLAASIVSSTAYFSNVTVPGNVAGGNLEFDPDFRTIPGGPFFASGGGFTALASGADGVSALRLVGPNPVGDRTRLVLTLGTAQSVRIDVLDALGRTVAILHDGGAPAGDLALDVDASRLPAGVYAVRVAGTSARAVQRLTVAR